MWRVIRSIQASIRTRPGARRLAHLGGRCKQPDVTSAILVLDRYVRGSSAGHVARRMACSATGACRGRLERVNVRESPVFGRPPSVIRRATAN